MCHKSCLQFTNVLTAEDVAGKRILEVGSYNVNGSVRGSIESFGCREYIGVDMRDGPGVDEVCDASDLVERFGTESFDIVISTEMMEHAKDWRAAISNMKRVCKRGGLLLITARAKGFPVHGHPSDYWRFEVEDMKAIFADCEMLKLENDPQDPGVFLLARKPKRFNEIELSSYEIGGINGSKAEPKGCISPVTLLRKYAKGKVVGVLDLKKVLEEARSFPPSHNRTVVIHDIGRKIAGDTIQEDSAAVACLIGEIPVDRN